MGYTTKFSGELKFTNTPTVEQLAHLKQFIDSCDPDELKDSIKPEGNLSYIQFELSKNLTGIEWDGSEKFYYAENAVNFILLNMQAKYPDFGLTGFLKASGEDRDDVWMLAIENGKAVRKEMEPVIPAKEKVCKEILKIMETYHEQDERGSIDSPGGLEDMGDVWRQLLEWERELLA